MSLAWVRKNYGVPAKRGARVIYSGGETAVPGTVRSARYGKVYIQLDGTSQSRPFHPTWKLSYLSVAPTESVA